MATTVADIIALAEVQAQEFYEDPIWIKYINAALDDLNSVVKLLQKKDSLSVTLTNGGYALTVSSDSDLVKAHEILNVFFTPSGGTQEQLRRLPITDNVSKGYKLTATELIYQACGSTNGTSRVDYYKKLTHAASTADDITSVCGLLEEYAPLVVLYVVAKSSQKEKELNEKNDAFGEYLKGKSQLALDRIWQMEPQNRKFIRKARIAALIGASTN